MLANSKWENIPQNIWEKENQKQRRRAKLIRSLVRKQHPVTILNIGCAEGYITKYLSDVSLRTFGIDLDLLNLRLAKLRVQITVFINASIEFAPRIIEEGKFPLEKISLRHNVFTVA